ncbi:MAG: hypothetical protein PHN37_01015 [Candidatus Pacebacteria bacterium]|nr:hypothetical protein [Candidatus Paceibacterota bacterium]
MSVYKELKNHAPFTFLATLIAVLVVVFINFHLKKIIIKDIFHFFHFFHIFVSALTTSALFYKYRKKPIIAFLIGILGSIFIGSISDIILPYLGGLVFNLNIHFHLPLIQETLLTLVSSFVGASLGILFLLTKFSHFLHVFLSVFASLFYLLTFTANFVFSYFLVSFFIVFLAVIIPCCISDIVFPLLFVKKID